MKNTRTPTDMETGTIHPTHYGDLEIVAYHCSKDIECRFLDTGTHTNAQASDIRMGAVKDIMAPSLYGVGVKGFKGVARTKTPAYRHWVRILSSVYGKTNHLRSYTIEESWLYFPNFEAWYDDNYVEGTELVKPIHLRHRVLGPDNAAFLPRWFGRLLLTHGRSSINSCSRFAKDGSCYLIINVDDAIYHIGRFNSVTIASTVRTYLLSKILIMSLHSVELHTPLRDVVYNEHMDIIDTYYGIIKQHLDGNKLKEITNKILDEKNIKYKS